ncbi:hypothetical protein HN51_056668 [Arachis hypogaea]|uniref:uncharacterized protein LOC107617232 n=1 Tax=Arachis ipaensis TaxID=130454 RepID=UPI0007AF487E|nr:uncharacterized protein LOC107617232 [Arachis ipaensis]XP_025677420.1 uncharacterized protein LOC112777296 isoform X1 [Arachis hypogaea]
METPPTIKSPKSEAVTPKLRDMLNIDVDTNNVVAHPPNSIITLDVLRKYFMVSFDLNQPVAKLDQGENENFMVVESSAAKGTEKKSSSMKFMKKKAMMRNMRISSSSENAEMENDEDVDSLIVMGCTDCYIYVMVSKSNPKCPRCQNPNLLDVLEVMNFPKTAKPNKRMRISQI